MDPVGKSPGVQSVPAAWLLRAAWLVTPLVAGPAFAAALAGRAPGIQSWVSTGLWVVWAGTLAATLVLRDVTLTGLRVVVPASVTAAGWAAVAGASPAAGLAAIAVTVVDTALTLAPATSDAFVDGGSYGPERRLALRIPAPLLFGPVPLAWALAVAGAAAGPLLLAAGRWLLGGVLLAVGWPVAALAVRSLHTLSRRWVVLVPAGVVLHDPLAGEALLFPRNTIARLGPAQVGADEPASPAQDRTGGALGLVLELDLVEAVPVPPPPLRGRARPVVGAAADAALPVDRLLFSPVRPLSLLRAAGDHRIPVAP